MFMACCPFTTLVVYHDKRISQRYRLWYKLILEVSKYKTFGA
jgi:hypothetical protein